MSRIYEKISGSLKKYSEQKIHIGSEVFTYGDLLKDVEGFEVDDSIPKRVSVEPEKTRENLVKLIGLLKSKNVVVAINPFMIDASKEYVRKDCELDIDDPQVKAPEDVRMILYTSGSTGMPKGVQITDQMLCQGVDSVKKALDYNEGVTSIVVLPWSFDAGLNHLLVSLYSGAEVKLVTYILPKMFLDLVRKAKGDVRLLLVPRLLSDMVQVPLEQMKNVKQIATTGGPVDGFLRLTSSAYFPEADLRPMYGQTEGFRATISPEYRLDSSGVPMDGVTLTIEDGEIVQSGPLVSPGYWNREDEKFRDGKLYTGDYGRIEDGHLYVEGRIDEMMKFDGVRISPTEIENLIDAVSVVFQKGDKMVVLYSSVEPTVDFSKIPNWLSSRMESFKLDTMPRLPNGKTDRKSAKEQFVA